MNDLKKWINELFNKEVISECKSATILRIIGTIFMLLSFLCGIIAFFCTLTTIKLDGAGSFHSTFNPMCFLWLIFPIISAAMTWAFAMAVADIVDNTHKIAKGAKTEEVAEEVS